MAGKLSARERAEAWYDNEIDDPSPEYRAALVDALTISFQAHEDAVREECAAIADESDARCGGSRKKRMRQRDLYFWDGGQECARWIAHDIRALRTRAATKDGQG